MKFRRKSSSPAASGDPAASAGSAESPESPELPESTDLPEGTAHAEEPVPTGEPVGTGPYDADELPAEAATLERIDLGSLLIPPVEGLELRLQVEETTGEVAAVLLTNEEGALELRAFAAPRGADLWGEVLPQLAADVQQRGGQVGEREGTFGRELVCQLGVALPDGEQGVQPSRIIGVNGPRWLLRATFLGRPAVEMEAGEAWEQVLRHVVVNRGRGAMPKGEALPLVIPADARRVEG